MVPAFAQVSTCRPEGKSCDECPMASTREGGKAESKRLSSQCVINAKQNSKAGTRLNQFYMASGTSAAASCCQGTLLHCHRCRIGFPEPS
ncbi:NucA/NucB deoxyribonuclease domain-containing protein [Streptomyces atratus]